MDAIERKSMVDLEDELGDLLFQVVFYSQLTRETNIFSFADVAETVTEKLIRRHPHVFSTGAIESFGESIELSPDQVVSNWEEIKHQEREIKRAKQQAADSDVGQTEFSASWMKCRGLCRRWSVPGNCRRAARAASIGQKLHR